MGAGFQALAAAGVQNAETKAQNKIADQHQAFEQNINDLISQRQQLAAKIPVLQQGLDSAAPGTPDYLKAKADYDQAHQALQTVNLNLADAYHPAKNPGAIQKFGHLLTDHVGLTKPEDRAAKAAVEAGNKNIAAGKATDQQIAAQPPTPQQVNSSKIQAQLQEIDKSDLSDDDKDDAKRKVFGVGSKPLLKEYLLPDGITKTWLDATRPDLIPQGATAIDPGQQTAAKVNIADWQKEVAAGTTKLPFAAWMAEKRRQGAPSTSAYNEGLDAYAKSHGFDSVAGIPPEYQQAVHEFEQNRQKYITQFGAATSHTSMQTDLYGQRVPVTVLDFKTPTGVIQLKDPMPAAKLPMGDGSPKKDASGVAPAGGGASKDPKAIKKEVEARNPKKSGAASGSSDSSSKGGGSGNVKVGPPAFAGKSKTYDDARAAYQASVSRLDTMEKSAKDAYGGDQQAMLSLVANHIGMTLGAQKGARINQAVWNEAVQSAPGFDKVLAKFGHQESNGDWVLDTPFVGYKGGVTLTGEQIKSMLKLAHEQVDTFKDSQDRIEKELTKGLPGNKGGKSEKTSDGGRGGGDKPPKPTKPMPPGATHMKKWQGDWYYIDDQGNNKGKVE